MPKKDLTKDSYYESFGLAESTLIAEREYFKSAGTNFQLKPSERAAAIATAASINSKLLLLQTQFDVFVAKYEVAAAQPPSQEMLRRSLELSAELAEETKKAIKGSAVLAIVTNFLQKWTALTSVP